MKKRSKLFSNCTVYVVEIKTQFNISMHKLRSDNAKKYLSHLFQSYMTQHGILHQTSYIDTHSQNGLGEKNKHLLETAQALVPYASSKTIWGTRGFLY